MTKKANILIVGVGGQGVILASEIISLAALREGLDVKKSEVHGMAQRGGSVVSNVRFGDKVYSPLIARGEADILLAFEQLEALRWVDYLKSGGTIITSSQRLEPLPVATGKQTYPDNIMQRLKNTGYRVIKVDALEAARRAGSQKAINTVLIGTLMNLLDISRETFIEVIKEKVPPKTVEINLKALKEGREKGVFL